MPTWSVPLPGLKELSQCNGILRILAKVPTEPQLCSLPNSNFQVHLPQGAGANAAGVMLVEQFALHFQTVERL